MKKLKLIIEVLIILAIVLEIGSILGAYAFFKIIANNYTNQYPWLSFAVVSLIPLGFVGVYIKNLVLIIKDNVKGYKYTALLTTIIFVKEISPFFEGKKMFSDVLIVSLFFLILGVLSLITYLKLPKEANDIPTKKTLYKNISIVVIVILFFVLMTTIPKNNNQTNEIAENNPLFNLKQDFIKKSVELTKKETIFPVKIDDTNVMVDITEEPSAIRYHIVVSGTDSGKLNNDTLKSMIISNVCDKKNDLRSTIDTGVNIEYSYFFKSTQESFLISFDKEDCLRR